MGSPRFPPYAVIAITAALTENRTMKVLHQQHRYGWLLVASLGLFGTQAWAEPRISGDVNAAVIADRAFYQTQGRIGVNQAAGTTNGQLNLTSIAVNANGVGATTRIAVKAERADGRLHGQMQATTLIESGAFAESGGLIAINQVAGSNNLQLNSAAVASGRAAETITEMELGAVSSGGGGMDDRDYGDAGKREARIERGAFRDASGLVQVNQVAGDNNRTANHFAVRVDTGP